MKFKVSIPEVHYVTFIVEAEDKEKALMQAKVLYVSADDLDLEYSNTKETEDWKIEEVK